MMNMASSRIGVLKGLEIGVIQNWVPTDATRELLVFYRFPPSSTGGQSQIILIPELDVKPTVTMTLQPNLGTLTRQDVDQFIYTAPHSIGHASLPVTVRARIQAINNTFYEATRTLHVVRRKWSINVEFKLSIPCAQGTGNEDYDYRYADDQTQNFHLADDLTVTADPFLQALPADAELKSCKCTSVLASQPGTVTFNFSSGSLLPGPPAHFEMNVDAQIVNIIPAITETCPNPTPPPATNTFTIAGSEPMFANARILARGFRPYLPPASLLPSRTAPAPSTMPDELPAWWT